MKDLAPLFPQDERPGPIIPLPLEVHLEQVERKLITTALEETHWNKTAAAKRLGISFRALRYNLNKLGLE